MKLTNEFIDKLKAGVVKVFYHKSDGTDTTVEATLNPELIEKHLGPAPEKKEGKPARSKPADQLVVFSLDRVAWRSLKHEGITGWSA